MRFLIVISVILICITITDAQPITLQDVSAMAWNHDGTELAIGYFDGSLKIINIEDMNIIFTMPQREYAIGYLSWDSTGEKLAIGFLYYGTEIWDVANIQIIQFISDTGSIVWSNDTAYIFIATASEAPSLNKYDVVTGSLLQQNNEIFTTYLVLLSDNTSAIGISAGNVLFIRLNDFSLIKSFTATDDNNYILPPIVLAISPDEQLIATGYADNKIRVWDISTEEIIATLDGGGQIEDYSYISEIIFNASGTRLFTVSRVGAIRTWDTSTWQLVEEVDLNIELTSNASLSPYGRQLGFSPRGNSLEINIQDLCDFVAPDVTSLLTIMPQANIFSEEAQICLTENATYTLTASLPDITGDITLIGNGAQIVMTGGSRIFNVTATGGLHLKNVTLSGGVADDGGAIFNAGDLTLENVTLQNHSAVRGGAIYNTGNFVMNGGAIQNNSASQFGGGIYNLGDMQLDGVNIRENIAPEGSGVYQGG